MPLPNRVRPDGSLAADPARGLLMGNRGGRFHDPMTKSLPVRTHASRQWICCVLAFKDRKRQVWGYGYTELFFCDEVTALAAGHRPCMECRRREALAYRAGLATGLRLPETPLFPEIDRLLDGQRRVGGARRLHRLSADILPDGAMIQAAPARWLALKGDAAWLWSMTGYVERVARPTGLVEVLTPPASLAALVSGYRPIWHGSIENPG